MCVGGNQRANIIAEFRAGWTLGYIASKCDRSRAVVRQVLEEEGLNRHTYDPI